MNLSLRAGTDAVCSVVVSLSVVLTAAAAAAGAETEPLTITFNKSFEGGSLGRVEVLAAARFRCSVEGQYDEHGL